MFSRPRANVSVAEYAQRLRDEREQKRSSLDDRHRYFFDIIATRIGKLRSEVEDNILESPNFNLMDQFLIADGNQYLVFFYQEPEIENMQSDLDTYRPRHSSYSSRSGESGTKKITTKVIIANPNEQPLRGIFLSFIRNSKALMITEQNIAAEVCFYTFECNTGSLLEALSRSISDVYVPYLQTTAMNWGPNKDPMVKIKFIGHLNNFIDTLNSADESIKEKILLAPSQNIDLKRIKTAADYVSVASSSEYLSYIEEIMKKWIYQLEAVLAESEQIRREADDIGPRAELNYWKRRMTKFNFLLDQIKAHEVKAVLTILQTAKSKLIQTWRTLDGKITDAANEAKDNVRYLYTLEKFYEPLYNSDPVAMLEYIPGLINAVRMIHSISQYYNTSERMTSLFIKVSLSFFSSRKIMNLLEENKTIIVINIK
ncbi:unnamed protein product [Rotaria magnacalcarata]|uniref:Dynein heavy chain tail domain-containing protein n=3 Tax=Rotaria magnacalcarata TaxID=392030 RepID=A0A816ZCY3_9BILA|nr:unnamed protein product [Rotaria magnacalcarata]